MIFLSKYLPLFFYPLGAGCFFIILGLLLTKHRKIQQICLVFALAVLWIGGNRWTAYALTRWLEWQYFPPQEIPVTDVVVVLGGGTESAEYPRQMVELNSAGDRVLYAGWLYKAGKTRHILLSGGNISWMDPKAHTPASDMKEILLKIGVPEQAIWLENRSRNTYENAEFCSNILKQNSTGPVLLITSAMHMPRAVDLFRHRGIDIIAYPVDYTVTQSGWEHLFEPVWQTQVINLFPSASNLSLATRALKEILGVLYYRVRGFV